MNENITITTPACLHCAKPGEITMPSDDYHRGMKSYKAGAYIQDAFPSLSADQREMLKTGIHPECWKEIFPDEDEED